MDCEFKVQGCNARLANSDHQQAHMQHAAAAHVRLLAAALEGEAADSKALAARVTQLAAALKAVEGRLADYDAKQAEQDKKIRDLQASLANGVGSHAEKPSASSRDSAASLTPRSAAASVSSSREPAAAAQAQSREPAPAAAAPAKVDSAPASKAAPSSTSRATPAASTAASSAPASSIRSSAPADFAGGYEKGILWSYNAVNQEWTRSAVVFKMEKAPFAEGALRAAHKVEIKSVTGAADTPPEPDVAKDKSIKAGQPAGLNMFGDKYVSKLSKKPVPAERYFEDVKMQAICAELGHKFNQKGTPKPIQFLPAWVLEFTKQGSSAAIYCGLEPFIEGEFVKLNTNYGGVLSERNTPASFSHFSWEASNHDMLVIDLQGVKDFYTDPQIHTKDGKGFGLGNLGMNGIDRFLKSHKCNAICQTLNLPLLNVSIDTGKKKASLMKGTMKVPYIEDQLGNEVGVKWDGPTNFSRGEFQCVQTLSGHDDRVVSLCVGSKFLFSGTGDGVIKVWNLNSFTLETSINAHRKSVESMVTNSTHLFSASADHSIKVWDLNNFDAVAQLRDHVGEVNCICLSDKTLGYLISASFDKNIKVWNVRTLKCMNNLEGHTKAIKSLATSGSILFSASNDGSIMVWNLKYMSCLFTIDAHESWIKALVVHDRSLYSGAFDYLVKEWDIVTFNNVNTLAEHNDDVLALLATDKFLISASQDRSIMIWDYNTHKVVATIKGHRAGVQALASDGKHIFSGSDDYSVKVWRWT